jgi:hypothetical protein
VILGETGPDTLIFNPALRHILYACVPVVNEDFPAIYICCDRGGFRAPSPGAMDRKQKPRIAQTDAGIRAQ